ncbi:BRO family protein [Bacillus thuringiensis]|uniref:BRO family protein n=1 Tax=Bacillus thuringiensis TaxID=1428 RepID=UPI00333A5BD8
MNLSIVKSESFGNVVCDFYQNEKNEIFMTRNQIGEALEYTNAEKNEIFMTRNQIGEALEYTNANDAIRFIHKRHRERLDQFSVQCKLNGTDGKLYETVIYNAKGIYEICRWSKQPKADAFYDWVYELLEVLRKGEIKIMKPKQPKPRKKPVNLIFRQEMDMAKTLASVTGVKEGIAYAVAIERAEQKTGENFSLKGGYKQK